MAFCHRLYILTHAPVTGPDDETFVRWLADGSAFVVLDRVLFSAVLPRWFPNCTYRSFLRQLNAYGFARRSAKPEDLAQVGASAFNDSERVADVLSHPAFRRGHPEALSTMSRRVPAWRRKPRGLFHLYICPAFPLRLT
eukprot:m.335297 g.335297  ORF g.335297 m.335297 type:complete len:139 (+) comp55677_c0_seq6:375-791(+)